MICVCAYVYVRLRELMHTTCTHVYGTMQVGQYRVLDPLELEFKVVSYLM